MKLRFKVTTFRDDPLVKDTSNHICRHKAITDIKSGEPSLRLRLSPQTVMVTVFGLQSTPVQIEFALKQATPVVARVTGWHMWTPQSGTSSSNHVAVVEEDLFQFVNRLRVEVDHGNGKEVRLPIAVVHNRLLPGRGRGR